MKVPAIDGIQIRELANLNINFGTTRSFLSSMEQELNWSDENFGKNPAPKSANLPVHVIMSTEPILSLGIYPNPELNLIAAGSETGSCVGVGRREHEQ